VPKPTNMPSASFCALRKPDDERVVSVSSGILMAKVRDFLIDVLAELTLDGFYLFWPPGGIVGKKNKIVHCLVKNCTFLGANPLVSALMPRGIFI